jgi:hypothetical protein
LFLRRRKGAGNIGIFKPLQRAQGKNPGAPEGFDQEGPPPAKTMLEKANSLFLRLFASIRTP